MNPLSLFFAKYRLALLAVAFAAAFGAGFVLNGWRLNAKISQINEEQAEAAREFEKAARAKELTWNQRLQEAQNAGKRRETNLRNDAVAANRTSDRLRDELETIIRQLPDLADDAIRQRADTITKLFNECQRDYRDLAEKADRITSDRQTLMDAWPK